MGMPPERGQQAQGAEERPGGCAAPRRAAASLPGLQELCRRPGCLGGAATLQGNLSLIWGWPLAQPPEQGQGKRAAPGCCAALGRAAASLQGFQEAWCEPGGLRSKAKF